MTNQTEQGAERAAFEAWAKADNYSVERRGDNYAYVDTRDLWKGWQARAVVPTSEGYTSDSRTIAGECNDAEAVARRLTYNDDKSQAEAKHMLLVLACRLRRAYGITEGIAAATAKDKP